LLVYLWREYFEKDDFSRFPDFFIKRKITSL
jgi:hypothetical protein